MSISGHAGSSSRTVPLPIVRKMKNTRWMAATAVAALLGVAACSAAPRTVSIRSAGDSTPLAADPEPTTMDPTATTTEQPTVTTAPTATTVSTVSTATTQPTSSTTVAVTATTAPVTSTTVQPVTATTSAVTATTVVTVAPVLPMAPSLVVAKDSQCPDVFGYAVDLTALQTTLAAQGVAAPPVVVRDLRGVSVVDLPAFNMAAAKRALYQCAGSAGGPPVLSLSVPAGAEGLAQAVKAQMDAADWTGYTAYYPKQGLTLVAA